MLAFFKIFLKNASFFKKVPIKPKPELYIYRKYKIIVFQTFLTKKHGMPCFLNCVRKCGIFQTATQSPFETKRERRFASPLLADCKLQLSIVLIVLVVVAILIFGFCLICDDLLVNLVKLLVVVDTCCAVCGLSCRCEFVDVTRLLHSRRERL